MENIVFDELLAPVYPFIKDTSNSLSGDSTKFKLSFLPFTMNLWTLDKNSLYPPENPSEFGFCHNHAYTSGTMCFL